MEPPECPVCLQPYDAVSAVPRVLTCGHTTCEACLKQLPSPFANTLRCTVCTQLVKIPNSISALPKNLDLLHFSSVLENRHQSKDIKVNSPSSPPQNGKNRSVSFPPTPKSWSYEFYCKWKKWVIPEDCISIEKLGSGKVVKSFESDYVMGFAFRERENVGLVKVGIFVENEENSKLFRSSYEWKIVSILYEMKEEERDELRIILNAALRVNNVGKAYGFWYNEDDNCVYTVWQKFASPNLTNFVLNKKDEGEKISRDEISGLAMLGIETCEILSRLHFEGLVIGFLSVSCFGFDDFGRVFVDLSEVLNAGRRVNTEVRRVSKNLEINLQSNLLNENLVFISPEMLLQFLGKDGVGIDLGQNRHKTGYASDVLSLASLLVWLIVGSSYLEEMGSFLNFFINAVKDEKACDYSGLYMTWMEKIAELLKLRLGSECDSVQDILCKCLGFDPENRPVITELWKCLRESTLKPQCDIGLSLRQEIKKENLENYIVVLGEMCCVVEEIDKELINGINDKNDCADVEYRDDGNVVEGMAHGRVKCVEMKGHLDCITGLAVGGGFLFSSSYDKIVRVWSLQDFTHIHSFKGHEHRIMAIVFVVGEQSLCISGDNEGVICIWKADFPFSKVPMQKLYEKKDWRYSGIHAMAISGTEYLYTGSGDKLVKAWSLQDYTLSCEMSGHKSVVSSLIVCDGVLFSGSWDGTVRLWSLSDHSPLTVLGEDKVGNVASVLSLLADHNLLFVGHENGSIKIWHNDVLVKSEQTHKGAIFSVSKLGKWLFSGGWDKTINVQLTCVRISGPGFGLQLQKLKKKKKRWLELGRRRFKLLVTAQLSSSLSVNIGLDSQNIHSPDSSHAPWVGPLPGDIAEVEAYCRIFRAAERFHNALMDALCNPLTGECTVSYDMPSEDKPLLEDKIVSVLGCMVCLLNKGREDVLLGRSSIMSSFRDLDKTVMDDKVPPLANFRSEMKSYCESLHVALENYLTPGDDRSLNVWRKLQRLKNVCYDSGFPRSDNHPSQTLFANWGPVYSSDENSGVDFWKGGQVTEESLRWLVEKGFRTIIDLRAENVKDGFYEAVLDEFVSSRKIEVIKLPVEVGTSPSLGQVAQFTDLVSDFSKKPIYVHSKEGRRRTSSMISRWRHYMDRKASSTKRREIGDSVSSDNENRSLPQNPDPPLAQNQPVSIKEDAVVGAVNGGIKSTIDFYDNVKPLESQIPPTDIFSKKEMSGFFRNKKVSPGTYFSYERKRLDMVSALQYKYLEKEANSNLNVNKEEISSEPRAVVITNGSYQVTTVQDEANSGAGYDKTVTGPIRSDVESYVSSDDENMDILEGNMCASATGVVRLQSRKKAEMFLVRTDGYSCSREKVTESSLAFTHPSTQQQMLLWKSTPKTVLLLKKLGKELMEEAKEVASFLYYQEKMNVLVEPEVHDVFARIPGFGDLHERVDLVACLGGDGVILHASNLFRGAVPPVVSFNLGSLGFLTSHTFDDYKNDLRQVIHGNNTTDGVYITLRMRLRCQIFRNGKAMPGKIFDVLNEIVVDRGSNPIFAMYEVQGDGVIVATPTGSTAYSTAAGGSMVHPNVPCMLFTPICPHSLSFRPVILPDSARLELKIPDDARSNAWVSFDGKRRQQLSRGDSVRISMSQHPLPTVNKSDQTGDWFRSLIRCLNWNERLDQKAL
ncbi:NAD kinase 2 chloroplastic [Phtheirospermum japonicum]|uniref:NAD kinase 2 chloroplastic n=1 Tax=Phtheirospermum japonicum TaxID=374723 RepID=A0A830BXY7_9LAMI|nr:NAD kinase 2 chloroplastic [Phtheirospermum japonicum]